MKNKQSEILKLVFIFLAISYLLNLLNFINLKNSELVNIAMMLYGILTVYFSLGESAKINVFLGSIIFMSGFILSLANTFDIQLNLAYIMPVLFIIPGTGFLMLYFDNTHDKILLLISIVFLIIGTIIISVIQSINLTLLSFILFEIAKSYWFFIVLAIGFIAGIQIQKTKRK